jgi:hypothetical protein
MAMHALEKEISGILKLKQGAKEDRQEYLMSLCKAAASMDDDDFYKFSEPAQEWLNAGIKAAKAQKELAEFGSQKKSRASAKDKDEEEDEGGETEKPAKKKAEKAPGGVSSVMLIRRFLADNQDATNEDILKMLEKSGNKVLSIVAIGTVRSDFKGVCRVLQEKGLFKRDVTLGKV